MLWIGIHDFAKSYFLSIVGYAPESLAAAACSVFNEIQIIASYTEVRVSPSGLIVVVVVVVFIKLYFMKA